MRTRRLTLQRETLTVLGADELALVAGGDALPTTPVGICIGQVLTTTRPLVTRLGECDSTYDPCVTSTCER